MSFALANRLLPSSTAHANVMTPNISTRKLPYRLAANLSTDIAFSNAYSDDFDAQSLGETASLIDNLTSQEQDGEGRDSSDDDHRQEKTHDLAAPTTADCMALRGLLAPLGRMLARSCAHPATQQGWSARIPVDEELLPSTVLHLNFCAALLTIEFKTNDWRSRELLQDQAASLRSLVIGLMPDYEVVVLNAL